MHNLTTILADGGASIPGKLAYTIADPQLAKPLRESPHALGELAVRQSARVVDVSDLPGSLIAEGKQVPREVEWLGRPVHGKTSSTRAS
jgi:hypothetical protein